MTRFSFGIIIIGTISLLTVIFGQYKHIQNIKSKLDGTESILEARNYDVEYWKDKSGRHKARTKVAEAESRQLEDFYGQQFDSLEHELKKAGIKIKYLEGITNVVTVTERTIDTVRLVTKDSISYSFSYHDKWLAFSGEVNRGHISFDQILGRDSLMIVSYYKREKWYKPKQLYVEATSYNPYTRFEGIQQFKVKEERPKRFSVGPYLGYGFDGPQIGVGVQYSVIRL
jgi:hypothetical protein